MADARLTRRLVKTAIAPHDDSRRAQRRREPVIPPRTPQLVQARAGLRTSVRRDEASEKSLLSSALHRPADASMRRAAAAYVPRAPLDTSSSRCSAAPVKARRCSTPPSAAPPRATAPRRESSGSYLARACPGLAPPCVARAPSRPRVPLRRSRGHGRSARLRHGSACAHARACRRSARAGRDSSGGQASDPACRGKW